MDLDKLERLAKLRDSGAITDAEFDAQKTLLFNDSREDEASHSFEESPRRTGMITAAALTVLLVGGSAAYFAMNLSEGRPETQTSDAVRITPKSRAAMEEKSGATAPAAHTDSADSSSDADTDESEAPEAVAPSLPSFSQFAVQANDAVAALQLERSSPFWDYRSRIKDAYQSAPNFSSNGVITTWGCGTGCQFGALVDRSSGIVHDVPVGGEDEQELDIQTRRGSNLMLANWNDATQPDPVCVFDAYVWTGTEFKELGSFPKKVPGSCPIRDE